MQFNNWDLVYSIHWDKSVSAVVDFETENGDVYVSPWWKNLKYPERLILKKDLLFKKANELYHIKKEDVNHLMKVELDIEWDIDNPPEKWTMNIWDQVTWRWYNYKLVDILDGKQIFEKGNALYVFDNEDIEKIYWTREQVIKQIYWLDIKDVVLE